MGKLFVEYVMIALLITVVIVCVLTALFGAP